MFQKIKPCLYPGISQSNDSVKRFFELADLETRPKFAEVEKLNTSMSLEAQYVISKLNQKIPKHFVSGNRNIKYSRLQNKIIKELQGEKRKAARGEAERFYNMFTKTNEWVCENYFPDKTRLFEPDFQKYPEEIDYSDLPLNLDERINEYIKEYGTPKNVEGFGVRLTRYLKAATYKIHDGKSLKWELKKFVRRYMNILKRSIVFLRYYLSMLCLRLNRRIKIFFRKSLLNKRQIEVHERKVLSEFLIIRILGNDHYPIHFRDQTLTNLEFILENEPEFKDCRKCFILNRIIDKEREQDLIDLLERYSVDYLKIPFEATEYAKTGWRVDDFGGIEYFSYKKFFRTKIGIKKRQIIWSAAPKINYVMNINSARNLALKEGKRTANWTFVLDGNCIFKKDDFTVLSAECDRNTILPYMIIPFARLSENDEYLENDLKLEAIYEPQMGFHYTAGECFNSCLPYGIADKAEFLKILGVPGKWMFWGDFSWQNSCLRRTKDKYLYHLSRSKVLRLSSGPPEHKANESAYSRFQSRLDSIIRTLWHLTNRYGTEQDEFRKIIFSDENLTLFHIMTESKPE